MIRIQPDYTIRTKYTKGHKRTLPVKYVVVHGTGGGKTSNGIIRWMNAPEPKRVSWYKRGIALFHYIIDRDGTIKEIIDPKYWVYHCSIGKMDAGTIGIELMNPSSANKDPYTELQYYALRNLIIHLKTGEYADIKEIFSHRYAKQIIGKGKRKNCPGNFDWEKFCLSFQNIEFSEKCVVTQVNKGEKDRLLLNDVVQ